MKKTLDDEDSPVQEKSGRVGEKLHEQIEKTVERNHAGKPAGEETI